MPFFQLQGKEGYIARVTKDGELKIYLEVDSINASNIVVRDPEDEDKQLVVNPDGSINVKNMDLALSALRDALRGDDDKTLTDLATLLGGTLDVQLKGSYASMAAAPVVGAKTVTATAAEIFAGASRLAGRRRMVLKNEDTVLRFRIGPSGVTQANGFPVEPLALLELDFDPTVDVPVYAISEGGNLSVAVVGI
ncbi:hypothetical protein [uncultured Halomonas sp.]|uniref:hypothetical protein n=1 Tax=uncultured Halomonas sp. TaxID=173971 RepID=UPI0026355665|nr:hypothetical protein [uncultured Halomonas sp.]